MEERTWQHNEIRIRQMWPNAQWGDEGNELRAIFKKHLSGLMQNHLYAAIDEVKVNFSSHQPELKWFISAYDRIVDSNRKFESGATRATDKWWVDFERPSKHTGLPYKYSTDAPDLKMAKEIAASTGGRVRNYTQEIEQDWLVPFLMNQDRALVGFAVDALRARGMLSKDKLPSDISKWKPAPVGFVTYQVEKIQTERNLMITEMQKQLNTITVGSILAADQLRELHGAAKAAQARLRELIQLIELSCIEHIETTGHDIELVDGKRWYVGTEKKIKAIDDTMILQAVLESSGGDVMKLTTGEFGVLCSSPWKNGAVKQLIGQAKFDELFLTSTVQSLETGKAAKVLKVADPAFLKGGTQ